MHFISDMHQPLHCENDDDEGGDLLRVIWHGHPDKLHWVWDSRLIDDIDRNSQSLAEELEQQITPQDRAAWDRGSIDDWILQSHRLAQLVAYGDLGSQHPPVIGPTYEREADPVVEVQLKRAGVRLAYVLNQRLRWSVENTPRDTTANSRGSSFAEDKLQIARASVFSDDLSLCERGR